MPKNSARADAPRGETRAPLPSLRTGLITGEAGSALAADGRALAARDMRAWLEGLIAPLGITRLADVTGLDTVGMPVVTVCRPAARAHIVSQGKGATRLEAEVSGILEAAEAYHAERITAPLRYATLKELSAEVPVAAVHALPRLGTEMFHPERRILWIEAIGLHDHAPAWLPYASVHLDFTLPLPPGSGSFPTSSTGLAAGATWADAIAHGLAEGIERDAEAIFAATDGWRDPSRRIDFAGLDGPAAELLSQIGAAGLGVAAWRTTRDIDVPAVHALVFEHPGASGPARRPSGGSGAHPDPETALARAIAEALQSRLTMISGVREDNDRAHYASLEAEGYAAMIATIEEMPAEARLAGPRAPQSGADTSTWLRARLAAAGYRKSYAVDLSRPEIGLPVVRVVIPGLEGPHDVPGILPGMRIRRAQAARGRHG